MESKQWWDLVKDIQGVAKDSSIPPLLDSSGGSAYTTRDKVDLLGKHFSHKMTVPQPSRLPPSLPVGQIDLTQHDVSEIRAVLAALEETKAVGPNKVSPRLLHRCSSLLGRPLSRLFETILRQKMVENLENQPRCACA